MCVCIYIYIYMYVYVYDKHPSQSIIIDKAIPLSMKCSTLSILLCPSDNLSTRIAQG